MTSVPKLTKPTALSSSATINVGRNSVEDSQSQLTKPLPAPPKKSLPQPQQQTQYQSHNQIDEVDNSKRPLPAPKKTFVPLKSSSSEPGPVTSSHSNTPLPPPPIPKKTISEDPKPTSPKIETKPKENSSIESCSKCKKVFAANEHKVSAVGHLYHSACYVCSICEQPFQNQFTIKNDQPYHVECYKRFRNSFMPAYDLTQTSATIATPKPSITPKLTNNFVVSPAVARAKSPDPTKSTSMPQFGQVPKPKQTTAVIPIPKKSIELPKAQHSASAESNLTQPGPKKLVIPLNIASLPMKRFTEPASPTSTSGSGITLPGNNSAPSPVQPRLYDPNKPAVKSMILSPSQVPTASPVSPISPVKRVDYAAKQAERLRYSSTPQLSSDKNPAKDEQISPPTSPEPHRERDKPESDTIRDIGKKVKLWGGIAGKNIMAKMNDIKTKVDEMKKEVDKERENRERNKEQIRKAIGFQDVEFKLFPGIRAKAISNINDGKLNAKAGDIIYITDLKLPPPVEKKEDDKKDKTTTTALLAQGSKGGGVGVWVGCFRGKQSYIPAQCVELMESGQGEKNFQKFGPLIELICAGDMTIALALCQTITKEEFSHIIKPLVNLFFGQGTILEFIGLLIEHEVELNGEDSGTLFRSNSVSSAVMSVFFNHEAGDYLQQLLDPIFTLLTTYPTTLEVDPSKSSSESLEKNSQDLIIVLRTFMDSILSSPETVPKSLKNICYLLSNTVYKRFPEATHIAVGGFFFLRGVTAAIVAPEGFGVKDSNGVLGEHRRTLVLISKIVQSISNGKAMKEAFMEQFNPLIDEYSYQLQTFFETLAAEFHQDVISPGTKTVLEVVDKEQTFKIHQQLSLNLSKLGFQIEDTMGDFVKTLDYSPFEALVTIMSELGPPEKF